MLQPTRILLLHTLRKKGRCEPTRVLQLLCETVAELGLRLGRLSEALTNSEIVALTIDDGYAEIVDVAPWLAEQGILPTVFLPTAFLGRINSWDHPLARQRRHLSPAEVRQLVGEGFDFGTHSHTHADFSYLNGQEVERELRVSSEILADLTGDTATYLAYPFGRYDPRAASIAAALGYTQAFLSAPGGHSAFALGRTPIWSWDTALTLRAKLQYNWLTPIEHLKAQAISAFSYLTPAIKRLSKRQKAPISHS
ncbi:MAG: polysaccharide deacetylase family protein [bacterium]